MRCCLRDFIVSFHCDRLRLLTEPTEFYVDQSPPRQAKCGQLYRFFGMYAGPPVVRSNYMAAMWTATVPMPMLISGSPAGAPILRLRSEKVVSYFAWSASMSWKRVAIAGFLLAATASTSNADWHSFWHRFHVDYHRNNAWPHPFREVSAAQTRAPFEVQRLNGWQLHNTLNHGLFREGDGQLSYAGQQQIQYIMTAVPEQHRTVFVVRGSSPAETDARLASVRSSLERYQLANAPAPAVMLIDRAPATYSGARASAINRAWLEAMPTPELPQDTSAPGVSGN